MATTADISNGICIEFNGELYTVVEFQHVKPGKGGAFVRTKLKHIPSGRILQNTFQSGVKINIQRIERRPYQFLYKDNEDYHFMHVETFEQVMIPESLINAPQFLKEGQEVEIVFHAETETPLFCELPTYVVLEITYSEPGLRGDTATNAMKPAILETGAEIRVPLFINVGDKIKVNTQTGEYGERVNKD
ncbi:MAG: elongation factor P [Bacteroidales bacterium]|jgi:elongation factor P|nr:elongation factor P [Bacteroidales bacterium]MDI3544658.1 elongation factor [Rikenellaceae bacterium]MDN5355408.1 elongation factor [Rikenellaceae bacterium]